MSPRGSRVAKGFLVFPSFKGDGMGTPTILRHALSVLPFSVGSERMLVAALLIQDSVHVTDEVENPRRRKVFRRKSCTLSKKSC